MRTTDFQGGPDPSLELCRLLRVPKAQSYGTATLYLCTGTMTFQFSTEKVVQRQTTKMAKVCLFGELCYFLKTKRHPTPLVLLYFKNNWVPVVWYYLNIISQGHPFSFTSSLPIADPISRQATAKDILVQCHFLRAKISCLVWIKERNTDKKSETDICNLLQNQPAG